MMKASDVFFLKLNDPLRSLRYSTPGDDPAWLPTEDLNAVRTVLWRQTPVAGGGCEDQSVSLTPATPAD